MDGRNLETNKQFRYTKEEEFNIIGVHSSKLYFWCSSNIKAAEVKDSELVNIVDLTVRLGLDFRGVFCMLKSGHFLFYQTDNKLFHEIHENGRVVRVFNL
jgi:hypothetical protein